MRGLSRKSNGTDLFRTQSGVFQHRSIWNRKYPVLSFSLRKKSESLFSRQIVYSIEKLIIYLKKKTTIQTHTHISIYMCIYVYKMYVYVHVYADVHIARIIRSTYSFMYIHMYKVFPNFCFERAQDFRGKTESWKFAFLLYSFFRQQFANSASE